VRKYSSEKDYPIILEAARKIGAMWGNLLDKSLADAGVDLPDVEKDHLETIALVKDILRAWEELGYQKEIEASKEGPPKGWDARFFAMQKDALMKNLPKKRG
jgi:hypothetical protein